jgi:hypothetical protein
MLSSSTMSSVVPAPFFLPLDSVKLGRFITNISHPHQGHHDPPCTQSPKPIVVPRSSYAGLNQIATSRGFGTLLTSFIAAGFTKRAKIRISITAEHVKTYTLDNSNEWFEEAIGISVTRTWVGKAVNRGDQVYMIVGFHTVTNARIVEESTKGGHVGGQINLPIGLSLNAAGAIAPFANLVDPAFGGSRQDLDAAQSCFLAPGELVCALQYRKMNHTWFSSKTIDASRLSNAQWVCVAGERYYEEQEEDDEDIIEVTLGENLVLDKHNDVLQLSDGDNLSVPA